MDQCMVLIICDGSLELVKESGIVWVGKGKGEGLWWGGCGGFGEEITTNVLVVVVMWDKVIFVI